MRSLGVSKVARSRRGFLTHYKRVGGSEAKVSEDWKKKRRAFIARHLPQYRKKPTRRRLLALRAWAYEPK